MSQMYYKDSNGVLIPMGTPGPQGPQGEPGAPGAPDFPTADARYVKKAGDTMTGALLVQQDITARRPTGSATAMKVDSDGAESYFTIASTSQTFDTWQIGALARFMQHTNSSVYTMYACDDTGGWNNPANVVYKVDRATKRFSIPTLWTAPTLLNGWQNYGSGFNDAGYCKDANGFVHLRGLVRGGTSGPSTGIFVLPVGFRPYARCIFSQFSGNVTGMLCRVDAFTDGTVEVQYPDNSNDVSLEGIVFWAG